MNITLNDLDQLEAGEFSYIEWWKTVLQNCLSYSDLSELYTEYQDRVDENMMMLYNQRLNEISVDPVERIRRGETLSQKEINHAIQLIVRND